MKKLMCGLLTVVILLILVDRLPAQATSNTGAAKYETPIVVLPSGCIRIIPERRWVDPYPWWYYNYPGISFYDDWFDTWRQQIIYRIMPGPDEFVGATDLKNLSYIYQAPAGAPNIVERSINCMLSGGAKQG